MKNQVNNSSDLQLLSSVLTIWQNHDFEDSSDAPLRQEFISNAFKVMTISQINTESDLPQKAVIFTYQDDPSDLCYFKNGAEIFPVVMGKLGQNPLSAEDGSLEELLGLEWGSDNYEDLVLAISK